MSATRNRAVIYVRVSTADQVENYSLDTQLRASQDYCDRHGLEVDRVFREEGESAKTANRPKLQEMINYCALNAKRRGIGCVVVYRVDRLARDVNDHTTIRASLKRVGVEVRAVQEFIDETPSGSLMEHILAAIAQFDNDVRAARTRDGMLEGLRRGRWMWQTPVGYRKPMHPTDSSPSLVPDPTLGPLVAQAFELVAFGSYKVGEVLARMTALGLQTRRGKPMNAQSFGTLLRNPIYAGRLAVPSWDFDGPGDFQPIITEELFNVVQARLSGKGPGPDRRRHDNPDFPLRRIVLCPDCGAPATGSWSRGRSTHYPYYRCPRRGCGGMSVRKEQLEACFVDHLRSATVRVEVFDLFREIVRDEWRTRAQANRSARAQLERRLDGLRVRRDRLVDAFVHEGVIDRVTFQDQTARLDADELTLRDELVRGEGRNVDIAKVMEFAKSLLTDLAGCWNRTDSSDRAAFARALYPDGVVYDDGILGTADTSWLLPVSDLTTDGFAALAPLTGRLSNLSVIQQRILHLADEGK